MKQIIYLNLILFVLLESIGFGKDAISLSGNKLTYKDLLPHLELTAFEEGERVILDEKILKSGRVILRRAGIVHYEFRVENNTLQTQKYALALVERLIREVRVTGSISDGSVLNTRIGTTVSQVDRQVPGGMPAILFDLDPKESATFNLEFISNYNRTTAFELIPQYDFLKTMAFDVWINSALLAIMFLFSTISIVASFITGSKDYLYYSGFVFFSGCALGIVMGYADYWLWTEFLSGWGQRLGNFSIASILLSLQFTRSYLKVSQTYPRVDRLIKGWMAINILNLIAVNTQSLRFYGSNMVDLSVALSSLMLMILSIHTALIGRIEGRYMLASWIGILSGVCLLIAARQGLIPRTKLTDYATHFGLLAQVITLGLMLMRNIKKLQEEKNAAKKQAEEEHFTSEEKRQMLRVLAHDISNPLSSITMASSIGMKKCPEGNLEEQKLWRKILRNTEQIGSLITLVRHLEAAESGKLSIEKETILLGPLLQELQDAFALRLADKTINLQVTLEKDDITGIGDRTTLFHSVLGNLLSNAIKFSDKNGKIDIHVSRSSNGETLIQVRDYGVGMTDEQISKIFNAHLKTSTSGTNKEAGTGFGLPIAKSFVEKMGGRIEVQSKALATNPKDHGTNFLIYLTASPVNTKRHAA